MQWLQNSNEIHTVTFPDGIFEWDLLLPSEDVGGADPDVSPLVFAPTVVLQNPPSGSEFVPGIGRYFNSGIMGSEPGQFREYDLTFTSEGTFGYFCVVHGRLVMSGEVVVVGDDEPIPSPQQAADQGRLEMAEALSLVPAVVRHAAEQVTPPQMNGDGTKTHTVMLGYSETLTASYGDVDIELMQFFPDKLTVHPGDTVIFEMSENNLAPHTVTFLNGEENPPLAVSGNGFLYLNSEVYFQSGTDVLTRTGLYNSGLMSPVPETDYTLTIGDIRPGLLPFLCLLHDFSGMRGELMVVPPTRRVKVDWHKATIWNNKIKKKKGEMAHSMHRGIFDKDSKGY